LRFFRCVFDRRLLFIYIYLYIFSEGRKEGVCARGAVYERQL